MHEFLGLSFATGTIPEIAALVAEAARAPHTSMLVTPNVHHVVALERQVPEATRAMYLSADHFLCDSKILGRLARWSGMDLTPRTGTDRVADLLALSENTDMVVAVAGPTRQQTEALRTRYPGWQIVHIDTPARLVPGTPDWDACVSAAATAHWNVLLCCLGFPKQETFAADVRARRQSGGVILCVGAAIDFLSGTLARAPEGFQRLGLEWLHRLLSDPLRLWRRYLVDGPRIFLIYLARELLAER